MQDLELFGFWRSSATFRVRVALGLKRIAVHETTIDLEHGDQHSAEFLAKNPMAALPALILPTGETLTQSLAILEYLEETAPTPAILPADPLGRARVRSIAGALTADTHPLVVPRVRKYLTTTGGFTPEAWRAWQLQWFGTGLRALESRLAADPQTGRFCHGDSVTMADICLASIYAVTRVFNIAFENTPTLDRIMAACDAQAAFVAAAPMKQAGAPI